MDFHATPLKLAPERAWRIYLGGSLLDSFHDVSGGGDGHFLPAALPAFSIRNTGEVPLTLLRFFGPA